MHKVSYVAVVAMSGALMLPVTAQAAPAVHTAAASPPSVTLSVAPFVKKTTINVKLPTDPGSTSIVGYYLSESPATPVLNAPGWKQAKPSTFTLSAGEGSKDIYAWVKGANGSLSARSHDVTLLDMTAPTVSMLVADTTPKRAVTISLSGDDAIGSPDAPAGITAWAVVEGTALPGPAIRPGWPPRRPASRSRPATAARPSPRSAATPPATSPTPIRTPSRWWSRRRPSASPCPSTPTS